MFPTAAFSVVAEVCINDCDFTARDAPPLLLLVVKAWQLVNASATVNICVNAIRLMAYADVNCTSFFRSYDL